jgi:PAS domain S-box-containing protein
LQASREFDASQAGMRLHERDFPQYFHEIIAKRSIAAPDVRLHPATRTLAEKTLLRQGVTALLDMAVWLGTDVVGVLCVEHSGNQGRSGLSAYSMSTNDRAPSRIAEDIEPREWTAEETMFAAFAAAMIGMALEQSKREQHERQYRYLVDNSTDGIYRTNIDGRFTFANAALTTILGYTADAILGKAYVRFVHPDFRLRAVRFYHQQLQERIKSTYFEFPALRKDGTEAWLGQNVQLVMQGDDVMGFQAVVRNISQRKLAESEIMKTLEKERQLGELKSRFVSMVLHELRTPLTGISLSTEILQKYSNRIDEGQKSQSYRKIFENVKRIVSLMDGVLLLSETEANKLSFKPKLINVEQFTLGVIEEIISDEEEQSYVCLEVSGTNQNQPEIYADETLLRHIIGHLLINAVKYSIAAVESISDDVENPVDIRLRLVCEPDFTTISISDKGIGIPADDLPFVFEAFHRAKNAAELIPGTGVGLSVVKQCVMMHHGTITAESVVNNGATFTVRIPSRYA